MSVVETRRFVVGIDGSEHAHRALMWTIDLARELEAEVIAVHAIPVPVYPIPPFGSGMPPEVESWREDMRKVFEKEWCARLADSGVKHQMLVVDADPVRALAQTAASERATALVVGARGKGALGKLLLGSVSDRLAHASPVPLVIVPIPQ